MFDSAVICNIRYPVDGALIPRYTGSPIIFCYILQHLKREKQTAGPPAAFENIIDYIVYHLMMKSVQSLSQVPIYATVTTSQMARPYMEVKGSEKLVCQRSSQYRSITRVIILSDQRQN